jgi:uncharacterized damage-inducible protein DinB
MKELLKQYAAFNNWANQRIIEAILQAPEEKQQQEIPSSFPTLQATLLHMWDAESAWWQRIKLQERLIMPSDNFNGTLKDITTGITQLDQQWLEWVTNASEAAIEHVVQYYNSKKEHFKQPGWQIILHVCNHNTYHRGQLVSMLRQLGIEKIPATDFVIWTRKK